MFKILFFNKRKISPTILDSHCAISNAKYYPLRILFKILQENLSLKHQSTLMAIIAYHTS